MRLSTARGARAPRRSYFVPVTSHRLRACDAGEIRWLRALAERAAAGARAGEAEHEAEGAGENLGAAERRAGPHGSDAGVSGNGSESEVPVAGTLRLGSDPDGLRLEAEVAELGRTAGRLSAEVHRRLGNTHGSGIAQAVDRLQDSGEVGGRSARRWCRRRREGQSRLLRGCGGWRSRCWPMLAPRPVKVCATRGCDSNRDGDRAARIG